MTRTFAIAAAAVAVLAVAGVGVAVLVGSRGGDDAFAQCRGSAVAGAGDLGGPFELVSETGETVTDETLLTEPALIYFGYTFCPDVCPLDTVRNGQAVDILAERGHEVLPVFISVDPGRDTPEVLRDFTDYAHPRMVGLTGTEQQIADVAGEYRAYYDVHDDGGEEFYLVDHSTFTYLVLPEDGFVDFFRREDTPEAMADRVACFLDAR
ncbi:SCO family protein [Rhodobacterales bacterium HKCCE2091]|nr:SCO family protein [Rhodobacterales bacterium HKCCE2091]